MIINSYLNKMMKPAIWMGKKT